LFDEIGGAVGEANEWYAFQDNGSKVLAVAHCDFVGKDSRFSAALGVGDETLVFSPQLDDRLGVYTILDLLPSLGIKMDVLLTDHEESAGSTAQWFKAEKEYNWIVGFDRRGTDAVTYEYRGFDEQVCKHFDVGWGTFSDISVLEHLGVKGVNVGVGYHGEHTPRCFFVVEEYLAQIVRFVRFYQDNKNKRFEHEGTWCSQYRDGWRGSSSPGTKMVDDEVLQCPSCGCWFWEEETTFTATNISCPDCGREHQRAELEDDREVRVLSEACDLENEQAEGIGAVCSTERRYE